MTNAGASPASGNGSQVIVVSLVSVTASGLIWGPAGWLLGWSLAEDTGAAPAIVRILDGSTANGALLAKIPLPISGLSVVRPSAIGWPLTVGCWLQIDAGTVSGSLLFDRDI